MAFIDELKIFIKAGDGGNGVVRWLHEKSKEFSGAAGGNGGRGSDVYVRVVRDFGILFKYKFVKELAGEKGGDGMNRSKHGKDGEDLVIDFPVGSIITNLSTGKKYNLEKEGEKILILKGGRGGLGNEHFKGSKNVKPMQFTLGKEGEGSEFSIELELFADIGLVGLPNAGKSSLLNSITNAGAKVGSYQFTTLEPNLGDMHGYIIADIPGLIEGASEGKGLGHKFLRHIKRTRIILHCISLENEDIKDIYKTIREELEKYDEVLAKKREIILLTKKDVVSEAVLKKALTATKKLCKDVFTVSILDDDSMKELSDNLIKILREK